MKKIVQNALLFCAMLIVAAGNAKTSNDTIIASRITLSNTVGKIIYNTMVPGSSVDTITNKDEVIYYSANVGVINPQRNKYKFKIICVDSKNNIIFEDVVNDPLYKEKKHMGKDIIRHESLYLRLDPEPGSMVQGRLLPWKNDSDYYIKLYYGKKLIGLTKFHYFIKK